LTAGWQAVRRRVRVEIVSASIFPCIFIDLSLIAH
jgi:hypothetical protein